MVRVLRGNKTLIPHLRLLSPRVHLLLSRSEGMVSLMNPVLQSMETTIITIFFTIIYIPVTFCLIIWVGLLQTPTQASFWSESMDIRVQQDKRTDTTSLSMETVQSHRIHQGLQFWRTYSYTGFRQIECKLWLLLQLLLSHLPTVMSLEVDTLPTRIMSVPENLWWQMERRLQTLLENQVEMLVILLEAMELSVPIEKMDPWWSIPTKRVIIDMFPVQLLMLLLRWEVQTRRTNTPDKMSWLQEQVHQVLHQTQHQTVMEVSRFPPLLLLSDNFLLLDPTTCSSMECPLQCLILLTLECMPIKLLLPDQDRVLHPFLPPIIIPFIILIIIYLFIIWTIIDIIILRHPLIPYFTLLPE